MSQPLRCGSTTSDALGRSKAVGYRYVRPSTAKNTDGLTNILTVRIEHGGYLEHHVSSQSPSTRGFAREEVDHPVDNELRRCLPRVDSTMLVAFNNRVLAGSWTCWWTRLQREQHSKYIASFAVILLLETQYVDGKCHRGSHASITAQRRQLLVQAYGRMSPRA